MAISVGDALLTVGVDTKDLDKGMKGIGASIKKHQKAIGLGMVAAGGAILAAGALSIKTFAQMGDEVHKMALRTGFATESLSRFKYALEIGGAELGTLEKGVKKMSMTISDAKDGLATYTREFDKIGVSVEELEGLSPEDQFMKIALAVAAIEDPMQRASSAQKIFGKAGTAMLPMLADGEEGLRKMLAEAEKFSPIFGKEAAEAAAKLTDQMGQLKGATTKVQMVIAEQLVPILIPLIDKIRDIIAGISEWAKEHSGLTRVIILGTTALGGLLLALGPLLIFLPQIITSFTILRALLLTKLLPAIVAVTIALWAKVAALFAVLAAAGPVGWAAMAVGIGLIATIATFTALKIRELARSLEEVTDELDEITDNAQQAGQALGKIAIRRVTITPHKPISKYQGGGLITEPTWLTRVGQSMPYGIMAEKRPEHITPGLPEITLVSNTYLDGDLISTKVERRLMDKVRLQG